eukprot:TRINITY_DN58709_c0_g1_i1.p1 TRINITY_DN58709_c0_g1~~TRINITY_DN58709_c0_g1_i1.p1  ORF type:complete len:255 (-),score=25.48 TRINITY_DN58709_c0_g1_i1:105-869(-)
MACQQHDMRSWRLRSEASSNSRRWLGYRRRAPLRSRTAVVVAITLFAYDADNRTSSSQRSMPSLLALSLPGTSIATGCGAVYGQFLAAHPVPAKSLTAGLLFGAADVAAQRIGSRAQPIDRKRLLVSSIVGLFLFGPSAHAWFYWVLRLVPGSGFLSLLAKTALGQVFFGPFITSVFFAAALWGSGSWSWSAFCRKMRADLWPTVAAGLGFWPLMDFIAFALLSENYIPPFLNLCSFVWTIFLSLQAARAKPRN